MRDGKSGAVEAAAKIPVGEMPVPLILAAGLFALAAEALALHLVISEGARLVVGAGLHLLVVLALSAWLWRTARSGRDARFPLLLVAATAVLGPIGPAGVLLVVALHRYYLRSASTFESWYASLFPEESKDGDSALDRQLRAGNDGRGGEVDVVPFMDILSFGSRQQKQSMIALITTRFQPAFAPVLRQALNDGNHAIRVQAATAMTRVENGFLERSMRLSEAARRAPEDASTVLALARHYDSYAFAGILDDDRERENREKAIAAYGEYLELVPDDLSARAGLGRILVRKGEYRPAIDVLRKAIDAGNFSPQIVLWCMESFYRLGMFEQLREVARAYQPKVGPAEDLPGEVSDAVLLWASGAAGVSPSGVSST
jgi:polysaccharide biosynthesis protein PelE